MKNKMTNTRWLVACGTLALFALWTWAVRTYDVAAIGPSDSRVGFAAINGFFHDLTGVHMWLYTVTDWLGLVPIAVAFGYAVLGCVQWIGRKRLLAVDRDLFVLGGFYAAVMAIFLLFEGLVVNYRPVLIEGVLEASYPSSTTMLVLCVMPTAGMQCNNRIKAPMLRRLVCAVIVVFTVFMVIGRLLSGVHWLTDVIGGVLLSVGLVSAYDAMIKTVNQP